MVQFFRSAASKALPLRLSKSEAIQHVHEQVGEVRARYITVSPGQDMVYKTKEELAQKRTTYPLESIPLLAAEIGITGDDEDQVAQVILNKAAIWRDDLAPVIERAKLSALKGIEEAATMTDVYAQRDSFLEAIAQAGL